MSINRVNISGHLTRDPELRMTPKGTQVLSFGIAVNDRRLNRETNQWEDYPNFVECTMFGTRAEAVGRIVRKGMKVSIDGKLRFNQLVLSYCERRDQPVNQLKEYLIWIVLGIPGMVLIGLVLHSLVHFETGVLIIASMILGTFLMVFCAALCKSAHDGDLLSEMEKAATKSNFDLDGKGKLGEENEDDCDL